MRSFEKIKKFKFQNVRTSNKIYWVQMNSKEKYINYKVADNFEIYNFHIKFIFIRVHS